MRMRRTAVAPVLASLALVAAAGPASAANVVYTKDQNVFVTSPDGGIQRQITTNGAVDAAYRSPSEQLGGTIVAPKSDKFFWLFNLDGSSAGGPWTAFAMNSCSTSPIAAQVAPDSRLIVYTFIHSTICVGGSASPHFETTFANADSPTADGLYPEYDNYTEPRWIPGTNLAGMISSDGDTIAAQNGASLQAFLVTDDNEEFQSFDVHPNARDLVIVTTADGATSGPGTLSVWHNDGTPPVGSGQLGCVSPDAVDWDSKPRWSPDGSMITWATSQGVWVSPAPQGASGQPCSLQPRLIAAGGSDPDWGAADLPAPPPPPPETPDTTPPTVVTAPAGRLPKLRTALRKGLTLRVTTNEPGGVQAVAAARRSRVARGSVQLAVAGTSEVVLKFTKKARKNLRRRKKVPLTVTVTVADSANNRATAKRRVTLKR